MPEDVINKDDIREFFNGGRNREKPRAEGAAESESGDKAGANGSDGDGVQSSPDKD